MTRGWIDLLLARGCVRLGSWRATICIVLLSLALASSTAAAEGAKRVVVQSFRGPGANGVRNHVVAALMEHNEIELVTSSAFERASGSALQDAAAEEGVSAIIAGRVTKRGKLLTVHVSVRDASSGNIVEETSWAKKRQQLDHIERDLWKRLGPALMRTSAPEKKKVAEPEPLRREPAPIERPKPAPREPEPVAEVREPEPRERPASADDPLHPALIVSVGPRLLWRSLDYRGATDLNGYSSYEGGSGTGPAFTLALNVQWFPGAHVRRGWPSDIGLELDADYSLLKSTQAGKELKTKAYQLGGALLFRLPLDSFEPRFRLGYLRQVFDVQAPITANLPGVTFQSVRIGLGTLIHIVRAFSLDVNAGFLGVFSAGELGRKRYAEDLSCYGWEFEGGATYRIRDAYGLRLGAEFRRYAFDTKKSENDRVMLPKGGSDDYLRVTLSFVYALEGK